LAKYSGGGQTDELEDTKYLAKDSEKGVWKKNSELARVRYKGLQLRE
jgi:hypothetical protein